MAKPELGLKRQCMTCGARFYDLNRDTIVCPICQSSYTVVSRPPSYSSRPSAKPFKKSAPFVRPEVKVDSILEDGEDAVATEAQEETADEAADDTLIEEVDDDNVDVTGIVDTPTHEDEKP